MPDVLPTDINDEDFKKWVAEKWGYKKLPMAGSTPAGSAKFFRTGDWAAQQPHLIVENCINCFKCYFYCPDSAITMEEGADGKAYPKFDYFYCKGCEVCAHECYSSNW
ncbi:MAG: 4Fe-4S dicluster domain-containing protein [Candidatus Hodarchaeales archaeon]|jgi:pyruvate ferredoxin oxidoreductase delta subunit